jgi:hypothetical protein
MENFIWSLIFCFLLGMIYALAELLSRFKNGSLIFQIFWGYFYIFFNGFLSILAFLIIKDFNIDLENYQIEGGKILLAGVSAMVVIRSWIISVSVPNRNSPKKGKTLEPSLAPLIQVFLDYVQKEFDRKKALVDVDKIGPLMEGLNFEKAALSLPFTCANLLITISEEEGKFIAKKISDLRKSPITNSSKLLNLGIILNEFSGYKVLEKVANRLREENATHNIMDQLNSLIEEFKE